MAALYLHNAVFSRPPQAPHVRNLSNQSMGTLRSSISATHSHPTEPLLDSSTSESLAYRDLLLRQPTYPDGLERGQNFGLSLEGDKKTAEERKGHQVKKVKRRLRRLKVTKGALEMLFGAWAIYNIVVYFLAYTTYSCKEGQVASLALGTSVTISLALLLTSALISPFRPYLLLHNMSIRLILTVQAVLQYFSLLFLLVPAVVSFVLTFAWRFSSERELRLKDRCDISIDVVWTAPGPSCHPSKNHPWGIWLALAIVRVLITFIIISIYLVISRAYHNLRRPSSRCRPHRRIRPSDSTVNRDMISSNHTAQVSLASVSRELSSPPLAYSSRQGTRLSLTTSSSDEDHGEIVSIGINQPPPAEITSRSEIQQTQDHDLHNFVDRFKSLVNQITQETDEGMEFARSEYSSLSSSSTSDDTFDPYLGYPTSVRTSPDRIQVLGGIIHRMSTIESIGSREMVSPSVAGSSPTMSNARSNTISTQSQSRSNSYDVEYAKHHEAEELPGGGPGVPKSNSDSTSSYYTSSITQSPSTEVVPPGF